MSEYKKYHAWPERRVVRLCCELTTVQTARREECLSNVCARFVMAEKGQLEQWPEENYTKGQKLFTLRLLLWSCDSRPRYTSSREIRHSIADPCTHKQSRECKMQFHTTALAVSALSFNKVSQTTHVRHARACLQAETMLIQLARASPCSVATAAAAHSASF